MNEDKRLVATDKAIDPAIVTAEDLVRAIKNETVEQLAKRLGWKAWDDWHNLSDLCDATSYIANLITLPTDKPTPPKSSWRGDICDGPVTYDRGTGYDHEPTDNKIIWRKDAPLPFDEPITELNNDI